MENLELYAVIPTKFDVYIIGEGFSDSFINYVLLNDCDWELRLRTDPVIVDEDVGHRACIQPAFFPSL